MRGNSDKDKSMTKVFQLLTSKELLVSDTIGKVVIEFEYVTKISQMLSREDLSVRDAIGKVGTKFENKAGGKQEKGDVEAEGRQEQSTHGGGTAEVRSY